MTQDHAAAVCDRVTTQTDGQPCINSDISEILFLALEQLKDQPKVEGMIQALREFFTKHENLMAQNDLVNIMADNDWSKPVPLSIVSKCINKIGVTGVCQNKEIQSLIDPFVLRCLKRLIMEACFVWLGSRS